MSPTTTLRQWMTRRFPRVCGDEPPHPAASDTSPPFSPREQG